MIVKTASFQRISYADCLLRSPFNFLSYGAKIEEIKTKLKRNTPTTGRDRDSKFKRVKYSNDRRRIRRRGTRYYSRHFFSFYMFFFFIYKFGHHNLIARIPFNGTHLIINSCRDVYSQSLRWHYNYSNVAAYLITLFYELLYFQMVIILSQLHNVFLIYYFNTITYWT